MNRPKKNRLMPEIPLAEPQMTGKEWTYVKDCLDTNWVSSAGKYVDRFESVVANYVGRKFAIGCVNGTAALHTALLVSGLKAREEVVLPSLTFIAPANAVTYVGAKPVFMDVQPDVWQMDPQKVKDFLTKECDFKKGQLINRHTKRVVHAILPVHIFGHPVDIDPILDIAGKFDLLVLEDTAESLGALYKGRKAGALGDIACLSFNGNKVITSGGGGMLVTDHEAWAKRARYLTTQAKDDPLESIHHEVGYNYRLTNIQAAMGVAQMEYLDKYIAKKRAIAGKYREAFKNTKGVGLPQQASWAQSTYWLYTILLKSGETKLTSRELIRKLACDGIQSRPFWHPLHQLKPFADCFAYRIETVTRLYREGVSLPSSVGLTDDQQDKVIQTVKKYLS